MPDATGTGISFNTISEQLGKAAQRADDIFEEAMKIVSEQGETEAGVNTANMINLQRASQQWAFKLDSVSKAQERLGDTMKNIVQKS